ncbi:ketopantoate reductase family protein [Actinomadura sp. SCN-SB]|uniref:ketopantoate reductase family protein n=1 Tax=Actinomadura sp. SCN-SB TaxID=3373092 RepID=UPI0037510CBC
MRRYVIIGAGAIGATVAAQLTLAGIPAVLIARGENGAVLRRDGLLFVRHEGERRVALDVASGPDEVDLEKGDVLVLATKSQDTERALQDWAHRPVRGAETVPILTLQNGLDNERTALRRFPLVLGAVVWLPASHLAPGEVVARAKPVTGAFWIGRYPSGHSPVADDVAADLRAAGFHAGTVPDIVSWKAAKLLSNLVNALDALYAPSDLRDQAAEALRAEGRRALEAHGIEPATLIEEAAEVRADVVASDIPGRPVQHSSTWQSLARAGSVETDHLNGEIVLLARLAGLEAPLNEAVQRRIARAAREGVAAGSLTDEDLKRDLGY